MKIFSLVGLVLAVCIGAVGQPGQKNTRAGGSVQAVIDTEKAFAKTAEQKGTRAAFLEYFADDGIIFQPTETNAKLVWQNRPESPAWLNWTPAWADVSSDGNLGYTTGGWTFHPKGKRDKANAAGEYLTIWRKQPDGSFKAVLDIGVSHPENTTGNKDWKSPKDAGDGVNAVEKSVDSSVFTSIFSKELLSQGYFNYFADDVVVLRDGYSPFRSKSSAFVGLEKIDDQIPKKSYLDFKADVSPVYGNMMYSRGIYKLTHKDQTSSSWNFVQIWKYRNGKWQIVADVFTPVRADQAKA